MDCGSEWDTVTTWSFVELSGINLPGNWFAKSPQYCYGRIFSNVTSRSNTISSINNITSPTDYIALSIKGKKVYFVPKGIDKFFPDLQGLSIYRTMLKSVKQEDFKALKNLIELQIWDNDLQCIDGDSFVFNRKLQALFIGESRYLIFIGKNLLKPLTELRKVDFIGSLLESDAQNRSEIEKLNSDLNSKYYDVNKNSFCAAINAESMEIFDLQQKAKDLYLEKLEQYYKYKNRIYDDTERFNGIIDAVTKNLQIANSKIESCIKPDELIETREVGIKSIWCDWDSEVGSCDVDIIVEFPNSILTDITQHLLGERNTEAVKSEDFRHITINEKQTLFLPINLGEKFPNLENLTVVDSGLFAIDSRTFAGMNRLRVLNLKGNKIRGIQQNAFQNLKSLTHLNLSENKIEELKPGCFMTLVNLVNLTLHYNLLTTIDSGVFDGLKSLKNLDLGENKLKFLSNDLLTTMSGIESVKFWSDDCILDFGTSSRNFSENIKSLTKSCTKPVELRCNTEMSFVDSNECIAESLTINYFKLKIAKVNGLTADETKNVTAFISNGQSMEFLPYQLAETFPKLEGIVIVADSMLSVIHERNFKGLTELKQMTIRNNKHLKEIEPGSFYDLVQLEHLDLSYNSLTHLPRFVFAKLKQLETLKLSDNFIVNLIGDFLSTRNKIKDFRMNNNRLTFIDTKIVLALRKANLIDFEDNTCINMTYSRATNDGHSLTELSAEVEDKCQLNKRGWVT